jgi:hypothetical protein
MDERPRPQHEGARAEPEFILPDRTDRRSVRGRSRIWVSIDTRSDHRAYSAKPGTLAIIMAVLVLGILSVATLFVLLGAFLIWVAAAALVAALILSGLLRGYFRRLP